MKDLSLVPRLLSPQEAAIYTGLSRDTIYDYVRFGILQRVALPAIPGRTQMRRVLIDKQDLDKLIDDGKPIFEGKDLLGKDLQEGQKASPGFYRKRKEVRGKDRSHKDRSSDTGYFLRRLKASVSNPA